MDAFKNLPLCALHRAYFSLPDLSFCLPTPLRGGKYPLGKPKGFENRENKIEFNANNFSDYGKNDRFDNIKETAEQEDGFLLEYFPVRVRNVGEMQWLHAN